MHRRGASVSLRKGDATSTGDIANDPKFYPRGAAKVDAVTVVTDVLEVEPIYSPQRVRKNHRLRKHLCSSHAVFFCCFFFASAASGLGGLPGPEESLGTFSGSSGEFGPESVPIPLLPGLLDLDSTVGLRTEFLDFILLFRYLLLRVLNRTSRPS